MFEIIQNSTRVGCISLKKFLCQSYKFLEIFINLNSKYQPDEKNEPVTKTSLLNLIKYTDISDRIRIY